MIAFNKAYQKIYRWRWVWVQLAFIWLYSYLMLVPTLAGSWGGYWVMGNPVTSHQLSGRHTGWQSGGQLGDVILLPVTLVFVFDGVQTSSSQKGVN